MSGDSRGSRRGLVGFVTASRRAGGLAGCLLLAACVSSTGGLGATTPIRGNALVRAPVRAPVHPAAIHMAPGLESVIGATSAELARQFGAPRLDVTEGDARKLQYATGACVLDIYLYPGTRGAEPEATYVDARRASDGQDVDRAACVAALRRPG